MRVIACQPFKNIISRIRVTCKPTRNSCYYLNGIKRVKGESSIYAADLIKKPKN